MTRLQLLALAALFIGGTYFGTKRYWASHRVSEREVIFEEAERLRAVQEEEKKKREEREWQRLQVEILRSQVTEEMKKLLRRKGNQRKAALNFRENLEHASRLIARDQIQDAQTILEGISFEIKKAASRHGKTPRPPR